MPTIPIPKTKRGRKPQLQLESLAERLRELKPGEAEVVMMPDHYTSERSFRGNLYRCMMYRGLRIRTALTDDRQFAVYLADH
jgi:hypothetical protein